MTRGAPARPAGRRAPRIAAAALALAACAAEPTVGSARPPARGGTGTYSALSRDLFVPRCATASCHGGASPAHFPSLDAGTGWASLVNVQSQQVVMDLVKPGVPDESWLLYRLRGTQGGTVMPPGDPLTAGEIAAVEAWILNGAPND